MSLTNRAKSIKIAIIGVGNCAGSLIEGLNYYRQRPDDDGGLLFPSLCGYSVRNIDVVAAFDVSAAKVGVPLREAIYQKPNNFVRQPGVEPKFSCVVSRGPTLDGNPDHLAKLVTESSAEPVDVESVLRQSGAQIAVNMLPTGSIQASEAYARAALSAGCGFINCIPTPLAQRSDFQELYSERQLPLLGDDIKSQLGTTILHRSLLAMLELRGATLESTSQINVGGNTDFANFVYRSETKLVSKRKSLCRYVGEAPLHVGHHYDPTKGPLKNAYIQIETTVFGGSPVKIDVKLESDDKPNCAGSVVDLIRLAQGALDRQLGGYLPEACAFYMKSPPIEMPENRAVEMIRQKWLDGTEETTGALSFLDGVGPLPPTNRPEACPAI